MKIVENEAASSGLSVALLCVALAVSRATFYRRDNEPAKKGPRAPSPRALTPVERDTVLATLHSDRFVDQAPAEVHAQLLDEGKYLCSTRTMYRILESNEEVRERRNQRRHPPHKKPELVATAPNQVWTWDITKLRGPGSTHHSLYVILDIFSRYVVGWLIAERESAELATRLIRETSERQGVAPGQVTILLTANVAVGTAKIGGGPSGQLHARQREPTLPERSHVLLTGEPGVGIRVRASVHQVRTKELPVHIALWVKVVVNGNVSVGSKDSQESSIGGALNRPCRIGDECLNEGPDDLMTLFPGRSCELRKRKRCFGSTVPVLVAVAQ
jgi:transposase InsO family protein